MTRLAQEWLPFVDRSIMRVEVLQGLQGHPKRIAAKYLYDAAGSELFEAICTSPEYYLTRSENALLQAVMPEAARRIGRHRLLIELGSGSGGKAEQLLPALQPSAYVPVDLCREALEQGAARLRAAYPQLPVVPVCSDLSCGVLPALPAGARVIFFPGSTIGNFEPREAVRLLARLRHLAGDDGVLLVGVDTCKDPAALHAAYNDAAGLTAAFNRNLLRRINRELEGQFEPEGFDHRAFFAADRSRVEMHLVSRRNQRVRVADETIAFAAGETIHTENSYKYTVEQFRTVAEEAGWNAINAWVEGEQRMALHHFVANR